MTEKNTIKYQSGAIKIDAQQQAVNCKAEYASCQWQITGWAEKRSNSSTRENCIELNQMSDSIRLKWKSIRLRGRVADGCEMNEWECRASDSRLATSRFSNVKKPRTQLAGGASGAVAAAAPPPAAGEAAMGAKQADATPGTTSSMIVRPLNVAHRTIGVVNALVRLYVYSTLSAARKSTSWNHRTQRTRTHVMH